VEQPHHHEHRPRPAVILTQQDCQQEEDWSVLLVHMRNRETKDLVTTFAEKGGGDAANLKPLSESTKSMLSGNIPEIGVPDLTFECSRMMVRLHLDLVSTLVTSHALINQVLQEAAKHMIWTTPLDTKYDLQVGEDALAHLRRFHGEDLKRFESDSIDNRECVVNIGRIDVTGIPEQD
jgi:hypothetical protein